MKCPVDNTTLVMADRNGVEIDYCPNCRGVWLDRGELDKIIDRAAAESAPPVSLNELARRGTSRPADYRELHDDDDDDRRPRRGKRRDSFLSELFDF